MSSSTPPTYIPTHTPLIASWSSYKDSTIIPLSSNLEQDLEVFRNLVIQSQNPDTLPDNREAARRFVEAFKTQRKRESDELVAKIDEIAEQMLSALEKAETVILSLRSEPVHPVPTPGLSHDTYPNGRTHCRQPNGTRASMLEQEKKEFQEEGAKKRAATEETWEVRERQSKEERDKKREDRDRRREERKRGEEKGTTREGQDKEVEKVMAGMEMHEKGEQEANDEKEGGN